jgi:hypothetical protein
MAVKPISISGRQSGELCRLLEERGVDSDMFQRRVLQRPNELVAWIKDQVFPVWRTIQIGTYNSVEELLQALLDAENRISDGGDDILKRTLLATEPTEVDLVIVTVAELGFPDGATRKQIYEKAFSLGLELCPAEVGPQLRLQYRDQPLGEWLLVAMEPIADSDGYPKVFLVKHDDDGLWLYSYYGDLALYWDGDDRWVFRRK